MKKCKSCGNEFKPRYSTLEQFCSPKCAAYADKPKETPRKPLKRSLKPIPTKSKKRKIKDLKYMVLRKEFLSKEENKYCPITGKPAIEIHHRHNGSDRDKYYLDTSTWMAVSREGHVYIHDHPKESREKGWLK